MDGKLDSFTCRRWDYSINDPFPGTVGLRSDKTTHTGLIIMTFIFTLYSPRNYIAE